jgi:hypothetical protein
MEKFATKIGKELAPRILTIKKRKYAKRRLKSQ